MPELKKHRAPVMIDYQREAIEKLPGVPAVTGLQNAEIAGRIFDGRFTVKDAHGNPARLAVVDEAGNVIESGVEREAWAVAVSTYCAMLLHKGHLTISTAKPETAQALGERSA